MTTYPSDVVFDALDDHITPLRKVLGDHQQSMDGRVGVLREGAELISVELAELGRIQKVWDGLLNGPWVTILGKDGGVCGVSVGDLLEVARRGMHGHGRLRRCGRRARSYGTTFVVGPQFHRT